MNSKLFICEVCGSSEAKTYSIGSSIRTLCEDCVAELSTRPPTPKKPWYKTKINWGFWVLIGGVLAFLITKLLGGI